MSEPQCPICGSLSDSERHNQLKKEYGELKVKEFKILLENAALQKRIAELEAAQQWHPASEPPENLQRVQIKTDGHILRATYVHSVIGYAVTFCDSRYIIARIAVDGWRELPPMPEVEA